MIGRSLPASTEGNDDSLGGERVGNTVVVRINCVASYFCLVCRCQSEQMSIRRKKHEGCFSKLNIDCFCCFFARNAVQVHAM